MNESIPLSCPKCEKQFKDVVKFNKHMDESHDVLHNSFPDLSLESGSLSNISYDKSLQCGKLFANEPDVKNNMERVHEFGELFQLYPCEECSMSASALNEIR